jgi:hypothetical protein
VEAERAGAFLVGGAFPITFVLGEEESVGEGGAGEVEAVGEGLSVTGLEGIGEGGEVGVGVRETGLGADEVDEGDGGRGGGVGVEAIERAGGWVLG